MFRIAWGTFGAYIRCESSISIALEVEMRLALS